MTEGVNIGSRRELFLDDLRKLEGHPVRLRLEIKDADLYSMKFS